MDSLEQKFREAPQDTQVFEKLVHKYTRAENWDQLIKLYVDHATAIQSNTKGEAYRYFLQASRLQKLHQSFSQETLHNSAKILGFTS